VIGCASRNGGSTKGVPHWRPHLRIEKELDYGDLIVHLVQYLPWDRTEDRVTPGWWGENYPSLAEASANARGRCAPPGWPPPLQCGEAGVPAGEVGGEVVVENTGPDLQEKVGAAGRPPHLLLLDHTAADDPVDGTLGGGGGDRLAAAVALAVVRDLLSEKLDPAHGSPFTPRAGMVPAAADGTEHTTPRPAPHAPGTHACTECRAGTPASETRQANDLAADV
jgi:hypothetical protein